MHVGRVLLRSTSLAFLSETDTETKRIQIQTYFGQTVDLSHLVLCACSQDHLGPVQQGLSTPFIMVCDKCSNKFPFSVR